jgi:hypothetical protein
MENVMELQVFTAEHAPGSAAGQKFNFVSV